MRVMLHLPRATYADYLAADHTSEVRHEFIDGVIIAMAGGSEEHNVIAGNLARLFGLHKADGCRYYTPDQRFWIEETQRGRYSDGAIICGRSTRAAHDQYALTNPVVVLEVLSPSTEGDDEGDKRHDFQSLTSLQAYVLAAQDERCVRVYRRDERGAWRDEPDVYRDGDSFELPRLTRAIAIAEIYADVLDAAGRSLLR